MTNGAGGGGGASSGGGAGGGRSASFQAQAGRASELNAAMRELAAESLAAGSAGGGEPLAGGVAGAAALGPILAGRLGPEGSEELLRQLLGAKAFSVFPGPGRRTSFALQGLVGGRGRKAEQQRQEQAPFRAAQLEQLRQQVAAGRPTGQSGLGGIDQQLTRNRPESPLSEREQQQQALIARQLAEQAVRSSELANLRTEQQLGLAERQQSEAERSTRIAELRDKAVRAQRERTRQQGLQILRELLSQPVVIKRPI